jgi:hypothetical protein
MYDGPPGLVGKLDIQSTFTFHFTLLDRIFLVDATYNDYIYGINVEQSGAMHSSEPQTTEPNPRSDRNG